ncbi:hypothetical protein [Nocardioides albus]|uniref:Collagen-like protein n=1 Tax=Nocardioides albus TaxID=1841 RepID=A0A7W5A249_9ACTN|nr:hypothetical protein [Nocardioides albus]MBB3088086.1 hypothetical protein [Nocardioides albus]GGU22472.1 hypothetical protein GCM10007979_21530 [Nocardioides albus]
MFKKLMGQVPTIVIAATTAAIFGGGGAYAAAQITSAQIADQTIQSRDIGAAGVASSEIRDQSITSGDVAENGVGTSEIRNGTITGADINDATEKGLRGAKGDKGDKGDTGAPGKDGVVTAKSVNSTATPIANIGGSFATRKTEVGSTHLEAGKYLVNAYGFFDRVDNSASSTPVLQLAVRGLDGTQWGLDFGTAFTGEFPATGNLEQTASSTRYVTVPAGGLDVKVYAFGYNADTSANGSGNYTVSADVTFVPVAG